MEAFIRVRCGTRYPPSGTPPAHCPATVARRADDMPRVYWLFDPFTTIPLPQG